jgi:GAF domain-containing protein
MRDGIRAYAGVPLRTSRGIVVGTVCAMDFTPRPIGPAVVRTLERFAALIAAEIERGRRPPGVSGVPGLRRGEPR